MNSVGRKTENRITPYLRKLKEKTGYKQQQLADKTGISIGTMSRYFAGIDDESASYEIVRKLVVCMGGSLDELAGIAPPEVAVGEEKLTADGYTEAEIKAILRWAGSEISRTYKAIVARLEARLNEKDERLMHRDALVAEEQRRTAEEHQRAMEEIEQERKRAMEEAARERKRAMEEMAYERKRAKTASIISYVALGLFVLLFILAFLLSTLG